MRTTVHWDCNHQHPITQIQQKSFDCCRVRENEQVLLKCVEDSELRVKVIYSTIFLDLTKNKSEQFLFVAPCDKDGFTKLLNSYYGAHES